MPEIALAGLDGTNPLAFLAALGVLEAVGGNGAEARLKWRHEGSWQPVLTSPLTDVDALLECLDRDRQDCIGDPALALTYEGKRDLKPPPDHFREYLIHLSATATAEDRRSVDWASAFATDVAVDNKGNTKPTALHFTAGQQQFLQMVLELVKNVTTADLREAIEGPWKYARSLPVLGWDATSSRDYALRASDPSTDKKLGIPGADWLAVRGLSFIQTAPRGHRVMTTGCTGGWKDGLFVWALWTVSSSASVIRSALRQDMKKMTAGERAERGIGVVLSSGIRRHDQGGRGSFEPASVV